MTQRQDAIQAYCKIASDVGRYFNSEYAYDCFCSDHIVKMGYRFAHSEKVIQFVKEAIAEKIERDGLAKSRWEEEV